MKISRPYYLGVYLVTQGEYEQVMGVNPSAFSAKQMDASAFKPPLAGSGSQGAAWRREACCRPRHEPSSGGDGLVGRRGGVLPTVVGTAGGARGETDVPPADGGGMGICLPGGNDDALVVRRRRGRSCRSVRGIRRNAEFHDASRWARSERIHGACTTCTARYGSGAWIGTMRSTTDSPRRVDPTGPQRGGSRVNRGGYWAYRRPVLPLRVSRRQPPRLPRPPPWLTRLRRVAGVSVARVTVTG